MRLQVTLLLVCVLFPKALTLKCYHCMPGVSGQCTDTQTDCPDLCASTTTAVFVGGAPAELTVKGCAVTGQCVTGSLNLGLVKINSKCCSSNLCNSNKPPGEAKHSENCTKDADYEALSLNGKKCYACTDDDCSRTMNCEGDEDQCISGRVSLGSVQMEIKGCASRSFCSSKTSSMQAAGITGSVSCCEGDMCNSAEGVKLSLLIMLVPLISILFI